MAALLRHGAAKRLIGGSISMVQRAQAAVADEPRRQLAPRLMHTNKGAGEEGEDIRLIKLRERRLRIQRDLLDQVEPSNKTRKK